MTVVGSEDTSDPSPDGADLARLVRAGFGWSLVNSLAGRLVTILVGLALARILVPKEFGTFAVAFLVLAIVQSMNELGVSVAVLRWPGDASRVARTAATLAIFMSVLLYLGVIVAAPVIASAVRTPGAVSVIRILGIGIVIDGITSIPGAMMARQFMQKRRAIADIAGLIPTSALSIVLALSGFGALSLVWGSLAGNAVSAVLILVLSPSRPMPGWHREDAGALLRIGLPLAGTSLALIATLNVDYIVVGRTLGTVALGYYLLAFNLSSWPVNLLSVAVRRVAIAGFSRVNDDADALVAAFRRSLATLSAMAFLAAVLLATLAEPLIEVAYGTIWEPAAAALEMLAVLGGLRVAYDLTYDLLAAVGLSRRLLVVQLAWLAGLVIALPLGARLGGIRGVGIAHCIVALTVVGPLYLAALVRLGISLRVVGAALLAPAIAVTVSATIILIGRRAGWAPAVEVLVLGPAGALSFLAVVGLAPEHRPIVRRLIAARRARRIL